MPMKKVMGKGSRALPFYRRPTPPPAAARTARRSLAGSAGAAFPARCDKKSFSGPGKFFFPRLFPLQAKALRDLPPWVLRR